MINRVSLVIYHKLLIFFTFFMLVWGGLNSLQAQNSNKSLFNNNNLVEITKGNNQVQIPVGKGVAVEFKVRSWSFQVLKSQTNQEFGFINLASIEDKNDGTVFYFYKLEKGQDILNFQRFDEENNMLYTYLLTIDWNNSIINETRKILHEDSVAKIYLLDDISQLKKEVQTKQADDAKNPQLKVNNVSNNESNESNLSTNPDESASNTTMNITQDQPIIVDSNSNKDEFINDIIDASMDPLTSGAMNNADLEKNPETTTEDIMEKDIDSMSYDEFIEYIKSHWNTLTYEVMIGSIDEWISSHPDMFKASRILWVYLEQLKTKINNTQDVENVIELCKKIIAEYPLGYEYFEAKMLYRKLKFDYLYLD